jgi:hypothetical protein
MKYRCYLLGIAIAPLTLVAAVCVSGTRQRSPSGPWIAEVVNTSDQPVNGVAVRAAVTDAAGHDFGVMTAFTCPTTIGAHGKAAAELFFATTPENAVVLPLQARVEPLPLTDQIGPLGGFGLVARVVARNADARFALVEVRNDSDQSQAGVQVCATISDPDGHVLEVGYARLFPTVLRPAASATVPIFFNTMPEGVIALFPSTGAPTSGSLILDASQLSWDTTRITGQGSLRVLHAAGQIRNTSGQDLQNMRVVVSLDGAPGVRVESTVGCAPDGGLVAFGGTAPVTVAIPVPDRIADPHIATIGIEAAPATDLGRLRVEDVDYRTYAVNADGLQTIAVSAAVVNDSSSWLIAEACATLRGAGGKVVGAAPFVAGNGNQALAPGERRTASGFTVVLRPVASADVAAPAMRTSQPIPIPGGS